MLQKIAITEAYIYKIYILHFIYSYIFSNAVLIETFISSGNNLLKNSSRGKISMDGKRSRKGTYDGIPFHCLSF